MLDTFLDVAWVRDHLNDPQIRIVDARSRPHGAPDPNAPTGAEQYAGGHIPGAIGLDYAHELADPSTPYATIVCASPMPRDSSGCAATTDTTTCT
jgi:3-mercaptopyruvate sulfurtransferase SseA